jgi:glycosyltransferase involved in cell wall biosynthesis
MTPRRVLMVVEPPDGGTAEVVFELARGLPGHGWEVELAAPGRGARYAELEAAGVPVHRLPLRPGYGSPREDLQAARRIGALLRARRFDLVHSHSAKAGVLARPVAALLRVPAVHSPHCFPFLSMQYSARRRALAARIERALAPLTRRIVCVCDDERREALTHRIAGPERLRVVHNGVAACPDAHEPPAALVGAGPLAATLSVLRDQKRIDVFLEACPAILAAVPDARVAIVGDGPLRAPLEARAAALGLLDDGRLMLLPFEPPAARSLQAIDVYVLPSDYEAFPVGILEALACGVPQVATAVGGTPEAVDEQTGRLVAPGDPAALAAAVIELLAAPAMRSEMAAASRRRHAERFTVERMVAGTAAVYEEACA